MRKAQKEQARDWAALLDRANGEIEKAIETNSVSAALGLLEQCQQAAINLGELIEQTEGEGFVTVSLLEDYCECIYQLHEKLEQHQNIDGKDICKELRDSLAQVGHSIQNDIRIRIEAVFLPYKASTWGMLEDFWRAANEDPNCDVYVIPLPYYYKNWDGSLGEMHYEGESYPEDVLVTSYNEFDFAKHQPDIIFIQNPYDEYNNTTSIHPFFYSANLKKYAEKLIYIPYFRLDEINPKDERVVDSMEHFVMMPGVVNADRVMVQSETMRQSYIDCLSEHMAEINRAVWEEKIIVSDCFESDKEQGFKEQNSKEQNAKGQNVKGQDEKILGEWLRRIQKSDGSRKKVILYFTSISTLFQYDDEMLKKLQDTFKVFKDNQDDIVLLWRPDPLIRENAKCLPAQLWESYQKLVGEYQREGWGIYVDEQDVDKAVTLSDAYYGDGSSLVRFYRQMDKPAMLQDVNVRTDMLKSEDIPVWASAFCVDGEDVWFVHGKINVLMKYSMVTKSLEIVGRIPNEKIVVPETFSAVEKYGDRIFLIPFLSRNICIYNIASREFCTLRLEKIDDFQGCPLFSGAYIFEKYLYCVPSYYEKIIKIDMENLSIEYLLKCAEKDGNSKKFISSSARADDTIIGVWGEENKFFTYKMAENDLTEYPLSGEVKATAIAYNGEIVYIMDYANARILKYSLAEGDVQGEIELPFSDAWLTCMSDGCLLTDEVCGGGLWVIDKNDKIIFQKNEAISREITFAYQYDCGIVYKAYHGKHYFLDRNQSTFFEWTDEGGVKNYPFIFTSENKNRMQILICNKSKDLIEKNELCNIESLITVLMNMAGDKEKSACLL